MRILTDRHHSDLLYSLQRLFEDRLGYELYVTIGHEWWDRGFWRFGEVWGDDRLARQFLDLNHSWGEVEPGLLITFDQCHPERPVYGATADWAYTVEWDYVLATVQENQKGFARFADIVGATYLYHIGNARQDIDRSLGPLILDASRSITDRAVSACEEFDHLTTFRYRRPRQADRITSFVNLLPRIPESWEPFAGLMERLPQYQFRSFGHDCPQGFITPVAAIAEEMALADWGYHDKPTGDGFGHVIHGWAAVGRPLIGHGRYYVGQRAEVFWQDGETCIDLDKHSLDDAARIIATIGPDEHERMCRNIRRVLEQHYTPAEDARAVAAFLEANR